MKPASMLLLGVLSFGCISCGKSSSSDGASAKKESNNALVSASVSKPDGIEFTQTELSTIGSVMVPSGNDWEKDDNSFYNEKNDITIMIQGQSGDFRDQMNDYTESFIGVNKKDAPNYEIVEQKSGKLAGVSAVRVDGKFNNGTEYMTRDYLFYGGDGVAVVMMRAPSVKKEILYNLSDYCVSTARVK